MKKIILYIALFISFLGYSQNPSNLKEGVIIGGDTGTSFDPIGKKPGQVYWNAVLDKFRKFNGTVWSDLDAGGTGGGTPTGFEALNEGNGIGWRLIGRNPLNYGNIGLNSIDASYSSSASSVRGATGLNSTAFGEGTQATGAYSFASGLGSIASGGYGFAHGIGAIASAIYSTSFGANTRATGQYSFAQGGNVEASGFSSIAMGTGLGEASGDYSIALGSGLFAKSYNEVVIGAFNTDYTPTSSGAAVSTDRLFVIGNGTTNVLRSNALTIFKSGLITAPSLTIAMINASVTGKEVPTKEWVLAQGVGGGTGLAAINEGNGIGWRLIGRNPLNYGNVGANAVDFGLNYSAGTKGAVGTLSFNHGEDNTLSGFGSVGFGSLINSSAITAFNAGINLTNAGYSNSLFGVGHSIQGMNITVVGQAANIRTNQFADYNASPSSKELFIVGNGTIANNNTAFPVLTRSDALIVKMDGSVIAPSLTTALISAEATGKTLTTKEWVLAQGVGGGTGHTIQSGGVDQTARAKLNFAPDFVVSDNAGNNSTDISFDSGLSITTTTSVSANASLAMAQGVNVVNTTSGDITITVQNQATVTWLANSVLMFHVQGANDLILVYPNGTTRTYSNGDTIKLWRLASDVWTVFDPKKESDSYTVTFYNQATAPTGIGTQLPSTATFVINVPMMLNQQIINGTLRYWWIVL